MQQKQVTCSLATDKNQSSQINQSHSLVDPPGLMAFPYQPDNFLAWNMNQPSQSRDTQGEHTTHHMTLEDLLFTPLQESQAIPSRDGASNFAGSKSDNSKTSSNIYDSGWSSISRESGQLTMRSTKTVPRSDDKAQLQQQMDLKIKKSVEGLLEEGEDVAFGSSVIISDLKENLAMKSLGSFEKKLSGWSDVSANRLAHRGLPKEGEGSQPSTKVSSWMDVKSKSDYISSDLGSIFVNQQDGVYFDWINKSEDQGKTSTNPMNDFPSLGQPARDHWNMNQSHSISKSDLTFNHERKESETSALFCMNKK